MPKRYVDSGRPTDPATEAAAALIQALSELPPIHKHPAIASTIPPGEVAPLVQAMVKSARIVGGEDLFEIHTTSKLFAERMTLRSLGQWIGQLFHPLEAALSQFSVFLKKEEFVPLGRLLDAIFAEAHSAELVANRMIEQTQFAAGLMGTRASPVGGGYRFTRLCGSLFPVEGAEGEIATTMGHVWFQASPVPLVHSAGIPALRRGVSGPMADRMIHQLGSIADAGQLATHCQKATNGLGLLRLVSRELGPTKSVSRFVTDLKYLAQRFPGPLPEAFTKLAIGVVVLLLPTLVQA